MTRPGDRPPITSRPQVTIATLVLVALAGIAACGSPNAQPTASSSASPNLGLTSSPPGLATEGAPATLTPTAVPTSSPEMITPEPTTALTPKPTPKVTPKPTPKPTPAPSLTLTFSSLTSPIGPGYYATATAKTTPGAACSIVVEYKSGPSTASGLGDKTAGSTGVVSWTWKVGTRTTPGSWPVTITCTKSGQTKSVTKYLQVT
jgi:hypothetical protein